MKESVYCYRFQIHSRFIQFQSIDVNRFQKSNSDYDIAVRREYDEIKSECGLYTFCICKGNMDVDSISVGHFQFKDIELRYDKSNSQITATVCDSFNDEEQILIAVGERGGALYEHGFDKIVYSALTKMHEIATTYDSLYMYRVCNLRGIDTIPKDLNEYIRKHQAFLELISKAKEVKELITKDETRDKDLKAYKDILMPIVQRFNDALSKFKFDVKELEL